MMAFVQAKTQPPPKKETDVFKILSRWDLDGTYDGYLICGPGTCFFSFAGQHFQVFREIVPSAAFC